MPRWLKIPAPALVMEMVKALANSDASLSRRLEIRMRGQPICKQFWITGLDKMPEFQ
jgi:hypothetical protein